MRRHLNLALASPLAAVMILATTLTASAARYSFGDASGQLYVQSFTSFTTPGMTENATAGDPYSCGAWNHINETMWFWTKASQPVPWQGTSTNTWIEVGYAGGINIQHPGTQPWCGYAYYYADYPNGPYTPWYVHIASGINQPTNNCWLRFVNNQIGSSGAYVIINSVAEPNYFYDQWCCSDRIDVGLEFTVDCPHGAGWYSGVTDDTPLDYYDLNWNVSYWRGCTIGSPPFPNNCSYQDTNMGGSWPNVWNDYRNWFTAGQ